MNPNLLFSFLLTVALLLSTLSGNAQVKPETGSYKFGKLMNIPERISGNFGEMRSGHFHSGIDYKTNERIGYEVYAAADGYVSRVKISAGGFGKAIYIDHPDGITTVYAHLRAFYPALDDSISKIQYSKKEFEVEIFPSRNAFRVTRGQLIGYAGNSGSSEGPHLHFETRHTASEKPFNPETVGYTIADIIPPVISSLVLYQPGAAGELFESKKKIIRVKPGKNQTTVIADTVLTGNEFFLGFESYDKAGSEQNLLGIRSFQLYFNDSVVYSYRIDQFAFDETRLVNAVIDYPLKVETGRTIILCKKLPGNKLTFMGPTGSNIKLKKNEILHGRLRVEDQNRNYAEVLFILKSDLNFKDPIAEPRGTRVKYGEQKSMSGTNYRVQFQKRSFYEDCWVEHTYSPSSATDHWSGVLELQPSSLAIHEAIDIGIKPNKIPAEQEQKLLMVRIDGKGKEESLGGEFNDGWLNASSRMLGKFVLKIDTLAPVAATPKWIIDGLTKMQMVVIPVNDNLAGIKNYRISVNGNWILGEYNSRYKEITIYPNHLPSMITIVDLAVELEDRVGNKSVHQFTMTR